VATVVVVDADVENDYVDCTDILAEVDVVDTGCIDILAAVAHDHDHDHNHNISAAFDAFLFYCGACEQESWQ